MAGSDKQPLEVKVTVKAGTIVLSRIRAAAGLLVGRVGANLVLHPDARTDVSRLLAHAANEPAEAARLWRATPLDGDPLARPIWAPVAAAYLSAVTRLAADAEAADDVDEAARWLLRGAATMPDDPSWLVRCTRLFGRAGRIGAARQTAQRAVRSSRGRVPLPPDITRLAGAAGR